MLRVNTTGVTSGAITAYPSGAHAYTPGFKCGSCCWIFSFLYGVLKIIVSSFVFLFWPVYYLSFFDLRFPVTPLVSSYFSEVVHIGCERFEATIDPFASIIPLEYTTAQHCQPNITLQSPRVSDCCLPPSGPFFCHIMVRTSCIWMRWWWYPLYFF